MRRLFAAALLGLLLGGCATGEKSAWIPISAKFNGQPLRLIADTGAEELIVWRATAKRLGLEVKDPPKGMKKKPWLALAGQTEAGTLRILGQTIPDARLRTFDVAPTVVSTSGIDGVIGWKNFRRNVFRIDAVNRRMTLLRSVPPDIATWSRFRIRDDARALEIEMPRNGRTELLLIDTGSEFGLELPTPAWREWQEAHPGARTTADSYYTPALGKPAMRELAWAPVFQLGPLRMTGLQIEHHPLGAWEPVGFAGNLGMAGLRRLECIVDGINGYVYLRPLATSTAPPNHNRLGATFHPSALGGKEWIAFVAPNTPAERAGIRSGDVLLRIGSRMALGRAFQPRDYWTLPAGTRLTLVLRRGKQAFAATVVLEDILGAGGKP